MNQKTDDMNVIIARYFTGEATNDEVTGLRRWIEQSSDNKKKFFELQDLWESLNPSVDINDIDVDKAERKVLQKSGIDSKKGFLRRFLKSWSRVAAILVLPLIAGILYLILRPGDLQTQDVVLATAYGCTSRTTLPDGSVVWLNANSSLTYPSRMDGDSRDVELKGEAYFSVKADKNHPFNVHNSCFVVTATGTEFNVNAYDEDATVTLVSGAVEVCTAKEKVLLQPERNAELRGGKLSVRHDIELEKYCSWRNGILIFDNEPLASICHRLQQIYNVEFELAPSLEGHIFHFSLQGESLGEVLHFLELAASVVCMTEDAPVSPDSAGPRQKVTITPAKQL